jgi:hypothetical protein
MQLYARVLEDAEERRLATAFWSELLSPAANAHGWRSPWLTTVPDDTSNLYSAIRTDRARGVILDHLPSADPSFDAWCGTFDEDGDDIDFLRIRTDGTVAHIATICGLFERWVGTDISGDDMDRLVVRIVAGDRSPLLGS